MPRKRKTSGPVKPDVRDGADQVLSNPLVEPPPFPLATTMFSAVLVALVPAVYWQVTDHQFLMCDDDTYVTKNPRVLQGLTWDGVRWAFQEPHTGNYHPLTWISHMDDVELFGLDAGAHHLVSVVLHAATAVLLLVTLRTMTGLFWAPVLEPSLRW